MKKAKAILLSAIIFSGCFVFCGQTAADLFIYYEKYGQSPVYKTVINELTAEIRKMVEITECAGCNEETGKIFVKVRKEIIFVFFEDRHNKITMVSSAEFRELDGIGEIRSFAGRSARCLYLFFEESDRH